MLAGPRPGRFTSSSDLRVAKEREGVGLDRDQNPSRGEVYTFNTTLCIVMDDPTGFGDLSPSESYGVSVSTSSLFGLVLRI